MGDWFNSPETRWLWGFVAACAVAVVAFRLRALTVSGAIAATTVGTLIVAAAGWWPGLIVVVFFTTSSALSMYSTSRSAGSEQVRGKRRDAVQVLANGGVPALCAVASVLVDDRGPWLVAMASGVAGAAADTWATEIGRFSPVRPRLITSLRAVPPGTSGAISPIGTAGSLMGSLLIALAAASGMVLGWEVPGVSVLATLSIVAVAGLAGSIVDSVLGASVQAAYHCPACNQASDLPVHRCGNYTVLIRGRRWMNNDVVNLMAVLSSAGVGLVLHQGWS
ncbi:MAG: DUF92 domain-containing protein [Thermomicrobiales bacterium]